MCPALLFCSAAFAQQSAPSISPAPAAIQVNNQLVIPHLNAAPKLEDFETMAPASDDAKAMAAVTGFVQREPKDGAPATQKTVAYVGYTGRDLYVVFVCFDSEPNGIRSHLTRRENFGDDDQVAVYLDTFRDKRRSYVFVLNPLGVQRDAIFSEGNGHDASFDTLWKSRGKLTSQGFIVWMELPFKSLRFPSSSAQQWGLMLRRDIQRSNESSFWPRISSRVQGMLNQEGEADGIANVSPGRNIQLIPYGNFSAFRALDTRDPNFPQFTGAHARGRAGLDAKIVLKDSLVLDLTANPDFSQVESDEPQVTVNQRFEVFFPEKRPFFLENSNYFDTPFPLVFTRRIADPKAGARLTGKLGHWAIGYFGIDDTAPGKRVPAFDVMAHERAYYNILRVNREIGKQSSIGFIYTDRELPCTNCANSLNSGETNFNRVGGVDYRWKISKNWLANGQAVVSNTKNLDGTRRWGNAYQNWLEYSTRKIEFNSFIQDVGTNFVTHSGFFQRPDFRRFSNFFRYSFRPEGKHLIQHGPNLFQFHGWDHSGTLLEDRISTNWQFEFKRQTVFGPYINLRGQSTLRPVDFSALSRNQTYDNNARGFFFYSAFFKQVSVNGEIGWGNDINFSPRVGPPTRAKASYVNVFLTLRPTTSLTIDSTYLMNRDRDPITGLNYFNNHIIRSKWNYQITKELSVRFIGQYDTVIANPFLTTLQNTKHFDADFLITWLLHPGTAVYVGYNSNVQNLDRSLRFDPDGNLLRTRNGFINDGRQIFVKVSWLFRY
jgi:hypothetical protein